MKTRNRLPFGVGEIALGIAVFVDFIVQPFFGILPFVGPFINLFIWLFAAGGFFLFYLLIGHSFFNGRIRKVIVPPLTLMIELVFGFAPGFTIMVFVNNREIRREDKEYNEKVKKANIEMQKLEAERRKAERMRRAAEEERLLIEEIAEEEAYMNLKEEEYAIEEGLKLKEQYS